MASIYGGWLLIWRLNANNAYSNNEFAGVNCGSTGNYSVFLKIEEAKQYRKRKHLCN